MMIAAVCLRSVGADGAVVLGAAMVVVQFVKMGQRLRMLLPPHWAACTSTEVV